MNTGKFSELIPLSEFYRYIVKKSINIIDGVLPVRYERMHPPLELETFHY